MKVKVVFGDKKAFTGREIDTIKAMDKKEIQRDIQEHLTTLCGANGRLIEVYAEWTYNRIDPDSTFYDDGIDIIIRATVMWDYARVVSVNARLSQITESCYDLPYGYGEIYMKQ